MGMHMTREPIARRTGRSPCSFSRPRSPCSLGARAGDIHATTIPHAATRDAAGIAIADLASEEQMFGWIAEVVNHGIRRSGYPADV